MADYGLKIWNASGTLTLDTTDTIARFLTSRLVTAKSSGNFTDSGLTGKTSIQFAIAFGTFTPHLVTRSGTTITYTARVDRSSPTTVGSDTAIMVFIYD